MDDDLRQRLDRIDAKLDGIGGYAEFHDAVERRFDENRESIRELKADLKELRTEHESDVEGLRKEATAAKKDRGQDWRQFVYSGMVPVIIGLVAALIGLWATSK